MQSFGHEGASYVIVGGRQPELDYPNESTGGQQNNTYHGGGGVPVGSVGSSGQASVNPWFRQRFKDLGTPVISGHIRKLVQELKTFLA